jgi:hypothetical protein
MSLSVSARKMVTCCWLAMAGSAVLFAQTVTPQGGEYPIAGSLPGDQTFPRAAINSSGGYLVWQDNSFRKWGLRIMAESLDANLAAAASPFPVSAAARSRGAGDQEHPHVALLGGGGAVVVWQGGKPGRQRIFARFIGANGGFLTRDVCVSKQRKLNQRDPQVTVLADGTVVVVWSSDGQDGDMQGVFARLFSSAGKPLGDEFQVNTFTAHNQRNPSIAALSNGNFVVAWISELERSLSGVDVYARIFDVSGTPVTGEIPVNSTTNTCANPSVAGSSLGGFAVAWSQYANPALPVATPFDNSNGTNAGINAGGGAISLLSSTNVPSTNSWDVFGCVFDSGAGSQTAPIRLNSYTYGDQFAPRVAAMGTNYLAVWSSLEQDNDPREGVFGQVLTGGGALGGTNDLHVNTTTVSRQIQPAVASDGLNRSLVVWTSFVGGQGSFDLFAQQYQISAP